MDKRLTGDLPVRVNSAGLTRCGPGWKLDATRTRAWPDLDLWLLVAGRAIARTPGGPIAMRPGTCLLMRGGADYEIIRQGERPLTNYWVHFDYLDPITRNCLPHDGLLLPWTVQKLRPGGLAFTLLGRVVQAMRGSPGCPDRAGRWFAAALPEVEAQPSPVKAKGAGDAAASPAWIADFCRRVNEAPQRKHSIENLARQTGYDPAYVCRLVRRHVGMSPRQFVTGARMNLARSLLRESAMSITSIAAAVGYQNSHFFSRHFAAANGVTASAYRNAQATASDPRRSGQAIQEMD